MASWDSLADWRLALIALWTHWLFALVCGSFAALAFALTLAFQLGYLAYLACVALAQMALACAALLTIVWRLSKQIFALGVSANRHLSPASQHTGSCGVSAWLFSSRRLLGILTR